jgi:fatty acid desaturase
VVFYSYPKLLFVWPLLFAGPAFYILPGSWAPTLAWVYLTILLLVLLTLGVDLEHNHTFLWAVISGMLFFLGKWLNDAYNIPIFSTIYDAFENLGAKYDPGFGLALSVLLAIPFAVMVLWARLQHKWRITHNEFEHYSFGRADDSLARGAKRVRSTYPDILELIIAAAGTLVIYSATGRQVLRRIPHVQLIYFVRKRINHLLEYTAVTMDQKSRDAIIEEEMEDETESVNESHADHSPESEGIEPDDDAL